MSDKQDTKSLSVEELEERSKSTDRILLIKAKEDAKKRVRDDPTAANIAALTKITELLERTAQKQSSGNAKLFKSASAILTYAHDQGYKLQKSKLHLDIQNGKLPRQADGTFLPADVERYMSTLKLVATPQSNIDEAWERQKDKDFQEIRRIKAIADKEEFLLAVRQGKYLPKDDVYMEFAARAAVLTTGLKTAFEAKIGELVEVLEGNPQRSMDGIAFLSEILERALNDYSKDMEFEAELVDEV